MNLAVLNFGEVFRHFDPVCAGSNPARVMDVCLLWMSHVYDELIPRPEESY